jgi:hypothetical protein
MSGILGFNVTSPKPVDGPSLPGLLTRTISVIWSPRPTFEAVMATPKWLGMLALTIVVPALITGAFMSTDVGQQALVAQQQATFEELGLTFSDEQFAQITQATSYSGFVQAGSLVVTIPVLTLVLSGLLFASANAFLAARVTFVQVYAVVVHIGVINIVQQLFQTPLNYARGAITSPSTLAAFVPMLEPATFTVRLLSAVDLFIVWQVVLLAIGLSVFATRRSGPVITAFLLLYAAIATGIAVVWGLLAS